MTNREKFLEKLRPHMTSRELENVDTAYMFSKYGHRNQFRDGGKIRYFDHPRAVANILIDEFKITDWTMIVVALLHDILEDSYIITKHRIDVNFGEDVAYGVGLLTKDVPIEAYLERLKRKGGYKDITVKLADRLHNLRTLESCTKEKLQRKTKETKDKYFPLLVVLERRIPEKKKKIYEYLNKEIRELVDKYSKI